MIRILYGLFGLASKTEKGRRSTFFPIAPVLALSFGFFTPSQRIEGGFPGERLLSQPGLSLWHRVAMIL